MKLEIRERWLWLCLVAVLVTSLYAGNTNLQSLILTPEVAGDNALVVNDSSGTNALVIDGSGDITTLSGTIASSGLSTFSGGLVMTAASSPASSAATPTGELWFTDASPDVGCAANELHAYNGTTWESVVDGTDCP